jgi:hypothetical protein
MRSRADLFGPPRRIALEWLGHAAASDDTNANGTRGSRVPLQ